MTSLISVSDSVYISAQPIHRPGINRSAQASTRRGFIGIVNDYLPQVERILTFHEHRCTIFRCISRYLEIFPILRLSRADPASASWLGYAGSTEKADGGNAKVLLRYDYSVAPFISLRYIGTKHPASAGRNSRSSNCFRTMAKAPAKRLVVCVDNEDYAASLEKRKIYVALRDAVADKAGMVRVIDESGEDYLYPKSLFREIALPLAVKRAVLAA